MRKHLATICEVLFQLNIHSDSLVSPLSLNVQLCTEVRKQKYDGYYDNKKVTELYSQFRVTKYSTLFGSGKQIPL
jgi:hypothetical protein